MSHEAQGHDPEEAPAPPASTRWSEEPVGEDDVLAPPFVPGRLRSGGGPESVGGATERQPAAAVEAGDPVGEAQAGSPPAVEESTARDISPELLDDEPFPFDAPDEPREETRGESAPAPEAGEAAEDDFPFDQFDIEGQDEPSAEAVPSEADMGWSPADLDFDEVARGEPTQEPGGEPAPSAAEAAPPPPQAEAPAPERERSAPAAESTATAEAAALLERLSRVLRTQGEDGIRQEMESADRMTALLAGLLAGYVSGRS